MKEVAQLTIPACSGSTRLEDLFSGKNVKIDYFFKAIMSRIGPLYGTHDFKCRVLQTEEAENTDDVILQVLNPNTPLHKVHALLWHLATTPEGAALLEIPKGNIILGYASTGGSHAVLFIDVDKIHFRARPLNKWGTDMPMAIVVG